MLVKAGVVLICAFLLLLFILSYALMGLAEEASMTLTWFDRLVGMVCCIGFGAVGAIVVEKLWPRRTVSQIAEEVS